MILESNVFKGTLLGSEAVYEYETPQEEFFNTVAEYIPETKEWILNGCKAFVITGPLPKDSSSLFLVIAQTQRSNMQGDASRGSTAFLVESSTKGVNLDQQHLTIGCRGLQMRSVRFDNVKISENLMLGEAHEGNIVAETLLRCNRLRNSLLGMGMARNLINELSSYVVQNRQCGVELK